MTSEEILKAEKIIREWFWQPDSWHRKSVVRYYESAPIQPDVLQLVVSYLKQQETDSLFILNKQISLGETWKATDAWFQTSPSDKWAGTESTKIRIYQAFKPKTDESDGPYTVENGCKYRVTHEFHWDVTEIPSLPASSSGINYTLQGVTRDKETGLFSCVVEMRETVQQDVSAYGTSETVFEKRSEEQHLGVKQSSVASTGKKASVSKGKLVRRKVTKNPDCTSDVENETVEEKPASNVEIRVRKTLRGTVTAKKSRNQNSPVSTTGLAVGETRSSEMTPGGLYDNTVETVTAQAAGQIRRDCAKTIFEHADTTVTNMVSAPSDKEAHAAGSGKTYSKSTRKTEEGTFDVTEQSTVETPVSNAVVVRRKTLRGTVSTTTHRNQTSLVDVSEMKVGETRRSEKTPGGRFNNTIETVVPEPAGEIQHDCDKTIFEHRDTSVTNQAEAPADKEAASAGGGKTYRKSTRMTEEGTFDVTEQSTEETPVSNAVVVRRKTLRGTIVRITDRNQQTALTETLKTGETKTSEKTPGGRYNNTTESVMGDAAGQIAAECTRSGTVVHTDRSVENVSSASLSIHVSAAKNTVVKRNAKKTDEGTVDVETETTTYVETLSRATSNYKTEKVVTTVKRHSLTGDVQANLGEASSDPDDKGAFSTRVTEITPIEFDTGWILWDSQTVTSSGTFYYHHGIRVFKNQPLSWLQGARPDKGSNVSIGVNINKLGRCDGSISFTDLYSWKTSGGDDGGSTGGTCTLYEFRSDHTGRRFVRTVTFKTRAYSGSGNDGAERSDKANAICYPGLKLGARTYAVGAPKFGKWSEES